MKTAELTGIALDWAVAQCEAHDISINKTQRYTELRSLVLTNVSDDYWTLWEPSTDWAQGGPIIEREKVCVAWLSKQDLGMEAEHYCVAHIDGIYCYYGQTPLIAAMRCYVSSKLGDLVEIPAELTE